MDRLSEIGARCDAATPGPWTLAYDCDGTGPHEIRNVAGRTIIYAHLDENAEFCLHARDDVPYLLGEIERLNKAVETLGNMINQYADQARDAIDQQEHDRQFYEKAISEANARIEKAEANKKRSTFKNEPLTLQRLSTMTDDDWVWVVFPGLEPSENVWHRAKRLYDCYAHDYYGKTWIAYLHMLEYQEKQLKDQIWYDAKADPPKTPGLYYGKKDDTNSMWACQYRDGVWTLDAYPETKMSIVRWAEFTSFGCISTDCGGCESEYSEELCEHCSRAIRDDLYSPKIEDEE